MIDREALSKTEQRGISISLRFMSDDNE